MKKLFVLALLLVACKKNKVDKPEVSYNFTTVFEQSEGQKTATYHETIAYYNALAETYPQISLQEIGETDSGKPLHVATFNSTDTPTDFEVLRQKQQILFINNGIHPGEPDGIDATMMLFRDLAQGKIESPSNTVIVTIPIYNVGGSLNRNANSRTNQNGPETYGFRGNARNYDLNRDFIKSDTKNAQTFAEIFHMVQPDVFIDTHVSNGADYQYTLTHLFTQHNKLGGPLGNYIHKTMMPTLEEKLAKKSWDITPYVNVFNRTPERGFTQFLDSPRYSTGYTSLFNTLGMMVETHMLKPYKQRVEGTYELLKSMIEITDEQSSEIKALQREQQNLWYAGASYPLQWEVDSTKSSTREFKGYEGHTIASNFTGAERLKYNRDEPYTRPIAYQDYFTAKDSVTIPKAYVISQGWHHVISLLNRNNVQYQTLSKDTLITVESYKISNYDTRKTPYEGHYTHYNTQVSSTLINKTFRKGDYLVPTDQYALRYLIETLEPMAVDSFFNWNFFDTILQQKEGFSPYVWEDKAEELLNNNPNLQMEFNVKVSYDEAFANNWYAQLDWLHKQSKYYEKAHLQYPVYRITE